MTSKTKATTAVDLSLGGILAYCRDRKYHKMCRYLLKQCLKECGGSIPLIEIIKERIRNQELWRPILPGEISVVGLLVTPAI